ncbi:MAG: hypothetical protein JW944_12950 [Deltaproteobacteria bacterium]|nr:hypothetical protein [Deltaproteobacteria bacterium]
MHSRFVNIFRFNKIFWWVICLLLILNVVFYMAFRKRQTNRIYELHNAYYEKRSSQVSQTEGNGKDLFLQARDDIKFFIEGLPERKEFTETTAELFDIFKRYQIDMGQTVYKPESVDYSGLFKYSTSLSIKGAYPTLKALLADIQESGNLFCIEDLSFTGNNGAGTLEMKVKISTYFR